MSELPRGLMRESGGKIVLLVIDGLGGLPHPERGVTELEAARLPNLDALAQRSSVGRVAILPTGLTPGSGPGHLSLFGYDPLTTDLGRGVLEALGSDYPLGDGEVAAREPARRTAGTGRGAQAMRREPRSTISRISRPEGVKSDSRGGRISAPLSAVARFLAGDRPDSRIAADSFASRES